MEHSEKALFSLNLMNNNIIFGIFIRYWISNFWIGSPRLSHSSWLLSLLINLCFIYFFHLSSFSEICIANIVSMSAHWLSTLLALIFNTDILIYIFFFISLLERFIYFLKHFKNLSLCNFYWFGWEVRYHCFFKVLIALIFSSRFIISTF